MSVGVQDQLRNLYAELAVPNATSRLRLETVLDALCDTYGLNGLADVLSDLSNASPNLHHREFARHVAHGGSHVTANFDTCIDRLAMELDPDSSARILHFHGKLDSKADLSELGARIGVIENGFPAELVERLDAFLWPDETRAIVFVGYSGSDFFDATPYLVDHAEQLGTRSVVWHAHADQGLAWNTDTTGVSSDLLCRLVEAGVGVHVARGRLPELMAEIARAWNLPPSTTAARALGSSWSPVVVRTEAHRRAATAALYARLGFRRGIIEAYGTDLPQDVLGWDRLADAYWGAGQYAKALDAWTHAFDGRDPADQARLDERRAAVLWITGALRTAERASWQAIRRWCTPNSQVGADVCARLLETYGRVVEHMRRVPDARWFIRRQRVTYVREHLRTVDAQLAGHEGIALKARLANVAHALDRQPDTEIDTHIAAFAESEALSSWLNYEHARLRLRAARRIQGLPPPGRADYEKQIARQRAIGAIADVARVYLLPGAARHFSPLEVRHAFAPVEMTRWHRIRLLSGYTLRWLKAQIGRSQS